MNPSLFNCSLMIQLGTVVQCYLIPECGSVSCKLISALPDIVTVHCTLCRLLHSGAVMKQRFIIVGYAVSFLTCDVCVSGIVRIETFMTSRLAILINSKWTFCLDLQTCRWQLFIAARLKGWRGCAGVVITHAAIVSSQLIRFLFPRPPATDVWRHDVMMSWCHDVMMSWCRFAIWTQGWPCPDRPWPCSFANAGFHLNLYNKVVWHVLFFFYGNISLVQKMYS